MKLNEKALANALAVFMGIIYVVCALGVVLFPEFSRALATSWFHGMDLGEIWTGVSGGNFVLGFVSAVAFSWVSGWGFSWIYNKFLK